MPAPVTPAGQAHLRQITYLHALRRKAKKDNDEAEIKRLHSFLGREIQAMVKAEKGEECCEKHSAVSRQKPEVKPWPKPRVH